MLKLLAGLAVLIASASVQAATLNDLYFGLDNMRGFQEVYWWFLSDGRVLQGLPSTGIAPADFEAACTAQPSACGTYTLIGDKLAIKYRGGQTANFSYKVLNGGIQLNYIILTPVKKYPAGTRLNGIWSRASSSQVVSSSSSKVTITAPRWITFKPDGTYSQKAVTGVDTESKVKGASGSSSSESQASGTYSIKDNVLMLTGNGKSERHMIFPAPGDNLNIDGQVFTKQK